MSWKGSAVLVRLTVTLVAAALALGLAAPALAGGQLRPADDEVVTVATPVFEVELAGGDENALVEVVTEAQLEAGAGSVGTCVPAPTSCTLGVPLADGVYYWTLKFQNRFCDGYMGELCGDIDRTAGPRRFEVAVPRVEPATIVLGSSIGAARIGMTAEEIAELYGDPVAAKGSAQVFAYGGGSLEVTFTADRVSTLSTTSSYYKTSAGFGVGSAAPRGWAKIGRELVRGRTRLAVFGSRVVRVTVTSAPTGASARRAQRR